jgi:hypothetical protein
MENSKNLWPEFKKMLDEKIRTPLDILHEQAEYLNHELKNIIIGQVNTRSDDTYITHIFYLIVPTLNNYHYSLFKVKHGLLLFPVYIYEGAKPKSDIETTTELSAASATLKIYSDILSKYPYGTEKPDYIAKDESEFLKCLEKMLHSDNTIQILRALYSQSVSLGSQSPED